MEFASYQLAVGSFNHVEWDSNAHERNTVWDQENGSTTLVAEIWETPYVTETYSESKAREPVLEIFSKSWWNMIIIISSTFFLRMGSSVSRDNILSGISCVISCSEFNLIHLDFKFNYLSIF